MVITRNGAIANACRGIKNLQVWILEIASVQGEARVKLSVLLHGAPGRRSKFLAQVQLTAIADAFEAKANNLALPAPPIILGRRRHGETARSTDLSL